MEVSVLLNKSGIGHELKTIAEKVMDSERINEEEGLFLYEKADLSLLALLADHVRENRNGKFAYYIKNIHIEPTNICIYKCRFCSYSRKKDEAGSWEMTVEEIIDTVK